MGRQPLAEVFGYPIDNMEAVAQDTRANCTCPFGNIVPECTKDKKNNPLGVCSIFGVDAQPIITCPIRFREGGIIASQAASFFFPPGANWQTLWEVRLNDAEGKSAGNIDMVLVSLDSKGKITDFGGVEIQAVYISGNVRKPFTHYMKDPPANCKMDWSGKPDYPRADYLSSSRKRLAPQLLFKGAILRSWQKKTAVVLNTGFFETLPDLEEVEEKKAEVAWLIYDLVLEVKTGTFKLTHKKSVFTKFSESLAKITESKPGNVEQFLQSLNKKLKKK